MSAVTVLRAMARAGIPHERILELIEQEEELAQLRRDLTARDEREAPLRAAIQAALSEPDRNKAIDLLRASIRRQAQREGSQ